MANRLQWFLSLLYNLPWRIFGASVEPSKGSVPDLIQRAKDSRDAGDSDGGVVNHFLASAFHHATNVQTVYGSPYHVQRDLDDVRKGLTEFERSLDEKGTDLNISSATLNRELFRLNQYWYPYTGSNMVGELKRTSRLLRRLVPQLNYVAPCVGKAAEDIRGCQSGRKKRRGIRVGFSSGRFGNTALSKMMNTLILSLPKDRFEIVLLFLEPERRGWDTLENPDTIGKDLIAFADRKIALPRDNLQEARELIEEQLLDVWVMNEVAFDPFSYELAFARLAPVQVLVPGHYYTSGIDTIDYFVSCVQYEHRDPDIRQSWYSERLALLNDLIPYSDPVPFVQLTSEGVSNPPIPREGILKHIFGSSKVSEAVEKHLYLIPKAVWKLAPDMDTALAHILRVDEQAVIIVTVSGASDAEIEMLGGRFDARLGIPNAKERIKMLQGLSFAYWWALLIHADVLIDSWPFQGYTTAIEGIRVGQPWVTLPHHSMAGGRTTAALMRELGCEELIADTIKSLGEISVKLVVDKAFRERMRRRVAQGAMKLFGRRKSIEEWISFLELVGSGETLPATEL